MFFYPSNIEKATKAQLTISDEKTAETKTLTVDLSFPVLLLSIVLNCLAGGHLVMDRGEGVDGKEEVVDGREEREEWGRRGEGVDRRNALVEKWKKKKRYGRREKRLF